MSETYQEARKNVVRMAQHYIDYCASYGTKCSFYEYCEWVGKSNGNHGNCTGVLCRCSVCGHEHTFFAYSLEPCANCGRTMKGMKNVPFKRELIVPRDVSPETLNLAEQVLTMVQEQLKERSLKMSTLKPLGNDEWHTVLRAVGTNEIDRVIEDVRYQLKCEGEA